MTCTSTNILDCYATNIVTTGIVSTSYFSSKEANISTLVTNNFSANNASVTDLSVAGTLSASVFKPSNISTSNLSVTATITATTGVFSGGVSAGTFTATNISARTTSSASTYTSYINASNISVGNLSITTVTATTANFSTLGVSTFNPTNISTTNLSVATKATIVNLSVSNIGCSLATFHTNGGVSTFGTISLVNQKMLINSQGLAATGVQIANSGNIRFEVSQNGVSSYENFYTSDAYISRLYVSTFSPANITTTTVNATNGNFSNLNVSNFTLPPNVNFSSVNTCSANICNLSVSYVSAYQTNFTLGTVNSLYSGLLSMTNQYDSPAVTWNTSVFGSGARMAMDYNTSTFEMTVYPYNLSYFNITAPETFLNVSSLNICDVNGSLIGGLDINACRFYISNISVSNLSTTNFSATTARFTGNVSIDTLYVGNTLSAYLVDCVYDNDFKCSYASAPMRLHISSPNTSLYGLRTPNYIDGIDTTAGFTIGANQTAGFINCCRSTRFYGNVLTDGNVNTITDTATLGIGQNITTGNINIGTTTMTGNISINTSGDCIFGCDRRSTWNTSDLISYSTQLGSNYSINVLLSTGNISGTNVCYLFYPRPQNISLQNIPVGLYMITGAGSYRASNGYDAITSNCYAGICYGTNASFTSGNTTRITPVYYFAPNLYSNASTTTVLPFNFTYVFNMSITGQKLGIFSQFQAANLATAGTATMAITSITVTKIA